MAVPVITKPTNVVSRRGETITPFKIKATETPLTAPKWTNPKIVPPNIAFTQGEESEVTGEIAVGDSLGTTTVGFVAHNASGNSAESTFTWEIKEQLPVITKPTNKAFTKGVVITPFVVATSGGVATKIEASGLPTGLAIAETGAKIGEVTGTPTGGKEKAKVKLKAETSDAGHAAEVEFEIEIEAVPVVTKPSQRNEELGSTFTPANISATEEPTAYAATNLPPGIVLNTSTGELTGKLTHEGVYVVTLTATNEVGTSPPVKFLWEVYTKLNHAKEGQWAAVNGWHA